ncbi:MAG: type II toxin-antitoxin system VapC family toxin [Candidatus Hydrogenedentota bacterium]
MRLLLDTHVFVWWILEPARVSKQVEMAIRAQDSRVFVSVASIWEIGIKRAKGKLELPRDLRSQLVRESFESVGITLDHALASVDLPGHHLDPFDRMIVAQARLENMTLATHDRRLAEYSLDVIWT